MNNVILYLKCNIQTDRDNIKSYFYKTHDLNQLQYVST